MMMETTKLSLAEQLKMEFMERYGLQEDQIRIELNIYTEDVALGRKILEENDLYGTKKDRYLPESSICDNSYGSHIDSLWVYKRKNRAAFGDSHE